MASECSASTFLHAPTIRLSAGHCPAVTDMPSLPPLKHTKRCGRGLAREPCRCQAPGLPAAPSAAAHSVGSGDPLTDGWVAATHAREGLTFSTPAGRSGSQLWSNGFLPSIHRRCGFAAAATPCSPSAIPRADPGPTAGGLIRPPAWQSICRGTGSSSGRCTSSSGGRPAAAAGR